jgi:hypothetical protein
MKKTRKEGLTNKGDEVRRGIILSLTGHPIPESVYGSIGMGVIYAFAHPFSLDFDDDAENEMTRLFKELEGLKTDDGVTPLSPCSERFIILPSLNLLSVLVIESIRIYTGCAPSIITTVMSSRSGQHEFKKSLNLHTFSQNWRKTSRRTVRPDLPPVVIKTIK